MTCSDAPHFGLRELCALPAWALHLAKGLVVEPSHRSKPGELGCERNGWLRSRFSLSAFSYSISHLSFRPML